MAPHVNTVYVMALMTSINFRVDAICLRAQVQLMRRVVLSQEAVACSDAGFLAGVLLCVLTSRIRVPEESALLYDSEPPDLFKAR
jgi:hypothetical protein